MQALGLIESKGLLAIIEAADTMVKSANVNILEKVYVGGGLVSISITGDIGAVKSAVDAGVSAINNIGENFLISSHVIPRPHYDLERIIETIPVIEKIEEIKEENKYMPLDNNENLVNENNNKLEEIMKESTDNETYETKEHTEFEVELNEDKLNKLVEEQGLDKLMDLLDGLKVAKIRKLARDFKYLDLTSKVISKLDKESLLNKIKNYYENK